MTDLAALRKALGEIFALWVQRRLAAHATTTYPLL